MHLAGGSSGPAVFTADDFLPSIKRSRGLFWSTVRLRHLDGQTIRIGGLSRSDAGALTAVLGHWLAPVRQRFLDDLEHRLGQAESLSASLVNSSRFIRHGEMGRLSQELASRVAGIEALMAVLDCPETLASRHATLKRTLSTVPSTVAQANERFAASEITQYASLFDTVESQPLTLAQRQACVVNDDHNLVLAGAGTGKTSVMIGRAAYLLAAGHAEPESLLMVAYNRDAAEELRARAERRLGSDIAERLTIKTFHALGVELIAEVEGVRPSVSVLASDAHALARFITTALDEALRDPAYAVKFVEYGFDRAEPHRSLFEFDSLEEYERELARLDLRTLRGERVKSYEEVRIANFLLRNGIDYQYEEPFPIDTATRQHRQYRPDFTLRPKQAGAAPVFLEHFGVDAQGNPPPFFGVSAAQRYREAMAWKRQLYQEQQLPLIETYSYQFRNGEVFERLEEKLQAHGFGCRARSAADCLSILREAGVVSATATFFADLVPRVRDQALSATEVRARLMALPDHERVRASLLWDLLQPILNRYESELQQQREIDFAAMIQRATGYVQAGRVRSPFTHVLVDEFQDISRPRAELILALKHSRPDAILFCVGDDWQSIYRFTGSDIRYTSQFETRVGPGSTTRLDRTFRFNDQIGRVASTFVLQNPEQVRKQITSETSVTAPAVSLVRTAEPVLGLNAVLERIEAWARSQGGTHSVYVLARYWHELEPLQAILKQNLKTRFPHLSSIRAHAVHGAKGQEADYVVLVGLEEGRHGFPADKPIDAFHEMFLPPREAFPFAEERRLFYVALTRARHRVYLLYDAVAHSPFLRELKSGGYPIEEHEFTGPFVQADLPVVPCPRCATGEIRVKAGRNGSFYGCHRYPACRYIERGCGSCGGPLLRIGDYGVCSNPGCNGVHSICPRCGAPMQHRSGPYGAFFGCSNYGRADLIEQCTVTEKWRRLPSAEELRARQRQSTIPS